MIGSANILAVDDTPANLDLLERILTAAGYEVRAVPSGALALRAAQAHAPDLILLDIRMPGMDGYEVCARLKADLRTRETPVIFISALQETDDKVRALAAGGVDYVSKPFQEEELLARVATHLRLTQLQGSLRAANDRMQCLMARDQAILNSAGEGIVGLDADSRVTFINPKAQALLGCAMEDLEGIDFHQWVHRTLPNGQPHAFEECPIQRTVQEGGTRFVDNDQFLRKDGRAIAVEYTVSTTNADAGQAMAIVVFRDITERRRIRRRMQEAAAVFEVSSEGIVLADAETVIQQVNPAFTEITGYTAEEAVGQTPRLLKSGHHPPEFYQTMWDTLAADGHWEGEIWNRRKDGSVFPEWQMITAIRGERGETLGYVAQFSDITRRKLTEEEIRRRGNYDALTGLVNRSLLLDRLGHGIKEHRRKGMKLGLLFIDLDGFKQVNDTLGHARGDLLLKETARRIGEAVREADTAARFGGDEFVILLSDLPDQQPCERTASQLQEALSKPFDLEGREARVGASIGIALFPDDGEDAETLLRNADLALYRAKDQGRGQVQFFTEEMEAEHLIRGRLAADLQRVLERRELMVHYQPIVDLYNGRAAGVEALVRWDHPELGLVSPARFIPIAEQTGLMPPIGRWVVETVCRQLGAWQAAGIELYASINVSPRQIPQALTPEWLAACVREAGLTPGRLAIEITENVFIREVSAVAEWLSRVRTLGFRVFLDDFGTGYSSLSYLQSFPLDVVKIDQSFVRGMAGHERNRALVRAIIAMSEGLGLGVVAEGVETPEQRDLLHGLRCTYGQGYLFSKPVSGEELESWVKGGGPGGLGEATPPHIA